ncbi:MAG: hypothetical protein J5I90_12135 [Caldilineales bacterium]|nr:hypothetical protein [Caldilineales bacterium]
MIARGILRGGLLGGVLSVAFSVLGVIPVCGYVALPLRAMAWALGGYVGGRIAVQGGARNGGVVAGLGAGIIAGILDGIASVPLAAVRYSLAGDTLTSLYLLPKGVAEIFAGIGVDIYTLDTMGAAVFFSVLMCGVTWIFAGILGAIAGGIAQALAE